MLQLKVISLILYFCAIAKGINAADKYTDENRPYEFGFTIEGEQHRHEKKDENGIIMGEFGFITADGVYHVTVYATDENGAFKILSMKNIRVKPYPTAGVKKGHSLPFPPSQNAPVVQGPSSSKSDQESKLEQTNKPKASPTKSCSHCKVPTTTTVAPKLTDLAVVSKDRPSISSSQSVYQQNNPQVNSGIQGAFRPQETNVNQNFPTSSFGRQNNNLLPNHKGQSGISGSSYSPQVNSGIHGAFRPQEANVNQNFPTSSFGRQNNNLQHNYNGQSGISGSSYSQNDGITNDYPQPNAPNFNSQQDNNETPRNYIQENDGIQFNQNGNRDYGNLNYPHGSILNSPQQAINSGAKNYQPGNVVNQFYQSENSEGLNNFNENLQPEQNIKQGFGNQNYPQGLNNFNQNLQPERNVYQMYPQELSDTNNDYAEQGKLFGQPQAKPSLSSIPRSNSEIETVNSRISQSNLRNPKQYNDIYSTNSGIGQPKGFRDILESQVNQPLTNKPTLVAAQMQIVPKDTDIFYKSPGENEGLPDGISKDDMTNLLYTFNYTVGFHGHHEEGYTNGAKRGYYYVTGRNGVRTRVDYVADENGFRPTISQKVLDILSDDVPKPETEKEERFGLKGYEFKWLYFPAEEARQR